MKATKVLVATVASLFPMLAVESTAMAHGASMMMRRGEVRLVASLIVLALVGGVVLVAFLIGAISKKSAPPGQHAGQWAQPGAQPGQWAPPGGAPPAQGYGPPAGYGAQQNVGGPRIVFGAGPLAGQEFPIGYGITVGQGPQAQVNVPDPGVFPTHVWVGPGPSGRLIARDGGSPGGTYVNQARIAEVELGDQAVIAISPNTYFTIRMG